MIVIGYPRYAVSAHGIVFDTKRGKIVPSHPNRKGGYLAVKLYNNEGIRKTCYVHRLVAMTYLPNPDNLPEVNHIDFDTTNNDVSNLEWISKKGNSKHANEAGKLIGFIGVSARNKFLLSIL